MEKRDEERNCAPVDSPRRLPDSLRRLREWALVSLGFWSIMAEEVGEADTTADRMRREGRGKFGCGEGMQG